MRPHQKFTAKVQNDHERAVEIEILVLLVREFSFSHIIYSLYLPYVSLTFFQISVLSTSPFCRSLGSNQTLFFAGFIYFAMLFSVQTLIFVVTGVSFFVSLLQLNQVSSRLVSLSSPTKVQTQAGPFDSTRNQTLGVSFSLPSLLSSLFFLSKRKPFKFVTMNCILITSGLIFSLRKFSSCHSRSDRIEEMA